MAYKIIVAFRATSGYVTDPTDGTYCLGEAYPTARTTTGTGLGLNLGWDIDLTTYARDRDSGVAYAPLAGINQQVPADSRTFRMTVPEAGLVAVRVAAGDATNANHAYWDILDSDGTTVLLSQTDQAAGAGEFYDASGVLRTSVADWVSNNVPVNITLSGTDFYFRKNISDPNFNVISMIELNRTASGATTQGAGVIRQQNNRRIFGIRR